MAKEYAAQREGSYRIAAMPGLLGNANLQPRNKVFMMLDARIRPANSLLYRKFEEARQYTRA